MNLPTELLKSAKKTIRIQYIIMVIIAAMLVTSITFNIYLFRKNKVIYEFVVPDDTSGDFMRDRNILRRKKRDDP